MCIGARKVPDRSNESRTPADVEGQSIPFPSRSVNALRKRVMLRLFSDYLNLMAVLPKLINSALAPFGVRLARLEKEANVLGEKLSGSRERPPLATLAVKRRCNEIFKQHISPLYPENGGGDGYRIWLADIVGELEFWYLTIATDGGDWRDSYQDRLSNGRQFQFFYHINQFKEQHIRVLDVGAGALTALGNVLPGKDLELIPTDALAPAFNAILADCGIHPATPVQHCDAERLLETFGSESFHFVNASNCIDHCYDPISAINNMVAVAKHGGVVLMGHHENVAVQENYTGLHQWNLSVQGGRFVVWNKAEKHFAEDFISAHVEISIDWDQANRWVITTIRKI